MNHVLYGATIPFLIGILVYWLKGWRASLRLLIIIPLAMAFMAIWASAPDIPRAIGWQSLSTRLCEGPHCDIFLWHHTLDRMENAPHWYAALEADSSWFAAGIAAEAGLLMAAAIRELFRKERA